jgi:hypothetical protein
VRDALRGLIYWDQGLGPDATDGDAAKQLAERLAHAETMWRESARPLAVIVGPDPWEDLADRCRKTVGAVRLLGTETLNDVPGMRGIVRELWDRAQSLGGLDDCPPHMPTVHDRVSAHGALHTLLTWVEGHRAVPGPCEPGQNAVDALVAYVQGTGEALSEGKLAEFAARAYAACVNAGLAIPDVRIGPNERPYGLMNVPGWPSNRGLHLGNPEWFAAMRGLSLALAGRTTTPVALIPKGAGNGNVSSPSHQAVTKDDALPGPAVPTSTVLAAPANVSPATPLGRKERRRRWVAEAMILIQEHPDLPDKKVAEIVGVHPSALSRCGTYQQAKRIAQQRQPPPAGHVDIDPDTRTRHLEAYTGEQDDG